MRRTMLALVLMLGCAPAAVILDRPVRMVEVENHFRDRVVVYLTDNGRRAARLGAVNAHTTRRLRIPRSYYDRPGVGFVACVGNWTPTARCTRALGTLEWMAPYELDIGAGFAAVVFG